MADISKISPDGGTTEYNIKDSTARTGVSTINGKIPSGASSSNKMATASDVTTITNGVIANTKLIKDTVGFSGKNKLAIKFSYIKANFPSGWNGNTLTINGITLAFEVNNNGYVTKITGGGSNASADTTVVFIPRTSPDGLVVATGDYKANGTPTLPNGCFVRYFCTRGGSAVVLGDDAGNGIECSIQSTDIVGCLISVPSGKSINGLEFNLMLCDADILDDTFEPYFGSTAFPRSEQAVLGAKNMIPYPYNSTTKTEGGVTFTLNDDGTVGIDTNGSASSSNAYFSIVGQSAEKLETGSYVLSGGANNNVVTQYYDVTAGKSYNSKNEEIIVPVVKGHTRQISIVVLSGTTVNNQVVKPMISFDGGEYVPPAMTNKELTDAATQLFKHLTVSFSNQSVSSGQFALTTPVSDVPTGYRPIAVEGFNIGRMNGLGITGVYLGTNAATVELRGYAQQAISDLNGSFVLLCTKEKQVVA